MCYFCSTDIKLQPKIDQRSQQSSPMRRKNANKLQNSQNRFRSELASTTSSDCDSPRNRSAFTNKPKSRRENYRKTLKNREFHAEHRHSPSSESVPSIEPSLFKQIWVIRYSLSHRWDWLAWRGEALFWESLNVKFVHKVSTLYACVSGRQSFGRFDRFIFLKGPWTDCFVSVDHRGFNLSPVRDFLHSKVKSPLHGLWVFQQISMDFQILSTL